MIYFLVMGDKYAGLKLRMKCRRSFQLPGAARDFQLFPCTVPSTYDVKGINFRCGAITINCRILCFMLTLIDRLRRESGTTAPAKSKRSKLFAIPDTV